MCQPFLLTKNEGRLFLVPTLSGPLLARLQLKECEDTLCTFNREKSLDIMNLRANSMTTSLICSDVTLFNRGEMSIYQHQGVITLVPKENSGLVLLKATAH